ncbi:hypothetical protein ACNS7O_05405 [Haloferacaceae archaeon DSL9]
MIIQANGWELRSPNDRTSTEYELVNKRQGVTIAFDQVEYDGGTFRLKANRELKAAFPKEEGIPRPIASTLYDQSLLV